MSRIPTDSITSLTLPHGTELCLNPTGNTAVTADEVQVSEVITADTDYGPYLIDIDFTINPTSGYCIYETVSPENPNAGSGILIEDLDTSETNQVKFLQPNGVGGVNWNNLDINVPANLIVINQESDFAVQGATTINLEDGKAYQMGASMTTSKNFIVGKNVSIIGSNPSVSPIWNYTGTEDMFNGVDCEFFNAENLSVRCENANQIFNFSDEVAGTTIFKLDTCIAYPKDESSIAAKKWGTFTDLQTVLIANSSCVGGLGIDDGISMGGTHIGLLSIGKLAMLSNSATYTGLDLGNVVVTTAFELFNFVNIGLTAGSVGITGLTNSGNIGANIVSAIRDCEFIGAITPLVNISESDVRYEFINNSPIPNSSKTADAYLTAQRITPITVIGQFESIGGTDWASDILERFTVSTSGVFTYIGVTPVKVQVLVVATLEKEGGGSDLIQVTIGHNGSHLPKAIKGTDNSSPTNVTAVALLTLNTGDTIEGFVSNESSTANVITDDCMITIINGF